MFDEKYIQKNIEIIFNIESTNLPTNSFHYIEEREFSETGPQTFIRPPKKDLELSPSDTFYLMWDSYETLKKLYNKIENDSKSRQIFIDILKTKIIEGGICHYNHDISSLALYFLLKIGKRKDIIETIAKRIKSKMCMEGLFNDILVFMNCEPEYFDDDMLSILKKFNCIIPPYSLSSSGYAFDAKIDLIRYNNLQTELAGVNEELNIHKEQVIDIISKFGFSPMLEKFLLEIDKTPELPDLGIINSGMIGNLRAFFEELIKNIANHIKKITKVDYPKTRTTLIGNLRLYIKEYLNLSDQDDKLIDAFIDILHKEGGHAFLSEKRYLLLAKNIGIEIAYFLLSKLEDFERESV